MQHPQQTEDGAMNKAVPGDGGQQRPIGRWNDATGSQQLWNYPSQHRNYPSLCGRDHSLKVTCSLWCAESNSIIQLSYKAGMIYSMIGQSIGCREITPLNLHTSQKKHYKFISQSHTYSAKFLELIYISIVLPETHLHTTPPPAHALSVIGVSLWWLWGWSQKSSSWRLDVFLCLTSLRCTETGHSHLFCIVPFFMFAQLTMKCWDVVLLP